MSEAEKDRRLEGHLYKTPDGRSSYEIYLATSALVLVAAQILTDRFGFSEARTPFIGFDEVLTDCHRGDVKLLLGWDNWSGFYVTADSAVGDEVVKEVGDYLDSLIQRAEFDEYLDRW